MGKLRLTLAVALAVLLAAFGLAACGGDDDGSSEDEDQITAAIERAATTTDPAKCTEVQTANFAQQTDGEPGDSPEEAVQKCQENAGDVPADSVDVSEIEVDGDSATAKALVTGSFFDGQTLDLALIKDGDQWKLDEFNGFAEFDVGAMANAVAQGLQQEGASQQAIECVSNQINSQPTNQVEAAFAENDQQAEDAIFEPCARFFEQ
jgi:predicted small secreted protein